MPEHISEGEAMGLVFGGSIGLALVFGGLAGIVIGIYPGWGAETPIVAMVMGALGLGLGCGLLGTIGIYHWHRSMVDSERDDDKTPLEF